MKAIIEALVGLSGAEPVIIAMVALVIFALVFRQISRTLREAIADEQMPLRKACSIYGRWSLPFSLSQSY